MPSDPNPRGFFILPRALLLVVTSTERNLNSVGCSMDSYILYSPGTNGLGCCGILTLRFLPTLQKNSFIDLAISEFSEMTSPSTLRRSILVVFDLLFSKRLSVFQVSVRFPFSRAIFLEKVFPFQFFVEITNSVTHVSV